jgi:hypothetical protein
MGPTNNHFSSNLLKEKNSQKNSEFKKTQVMKNKHVLLKIKKTKYCSVCCHGLELSNFMTI